MLELLQGLRIRYGVIGNCSNRESKYQGDERVFHFHTLYGDGTFDKGVLCVPDRRRFIAPLRRIKWVVYCKAPFAGPKQVLRYLSRYTHRVAISNRRLIAADDAGVAFRWKDYRIEGPGRWKTMRLHPHEFIRRFLMHVLPRGFHRIRQLKALTNCLSNRGSLIAGR